MQRMMRMFMHGEPVPVLSSIIIDYQDGRFRDTTSQSGALAMDAVYQDGELTTWMPDIPELRTADAAEDEMFAAIEQAFADPASLIHEDYDNARYEGQVDYGVVAGEQVSFELRVPGMIGGSREVSAVFADNGALLGVRSLTPDGPLLAISDEMMRTSLGLMPRGWTFYSFIDEVPVKSSVMRFWRVRGNVPLQEEMFALDTSAAAEAEDRAARRARIDELTGRLVEADPLSDEFSEVFEEWERLREEGPIFGSFQDTPCPGPY